MFYDIHLSLYFVTKINVFIGGEGCLGHIQQCFKAIPDSWKCMGVLLLLPP